MPFAAGLELGSLIVDWHADELRIGGGFSGGGGVRPRCSRMHVIENSSVMQATILSGPPHFPQTRGSAW